MGFFYCIIEQGRISMMRELLGDYEVIGERPKEGYLAFEQGAEQGGVDD